MKTLRIMALIAFICTVYSGFGQNTEIVLANGTPGKKATIKYLIDRIQELQSVQFSYSEEVLHSLEKRIEIPEGEVTLETLLQLIAKEGHMTVKKVGKNLVLKPVKVENVTISGYVTDKASGESLIGTTIQIKGTYTGAMTNVYGFYSLTVPQGEVTLVFSSVGYDRLEKTLVAASNQVVDIQLNPSTEMLEEVVVTGRAEDENVSANRMGHSTLSAKTVKTLPTLMGEADVIRTLKLLPGVAMTSETSSGFSVRGGGFDQNLILLDEAVVYNPSHLFGFFSTFNNDAIKNVEFYKGNMPARYGGRLSSLVDIRMKEGNNQKFTGSGGISPIASRLTLEVPIVKDKGSIIVSGRRTYADLLAKLSKNEVARNTTLYFYDLNMKANYTLNDKNRFYVSSYMGKDVFTLGGNSAFQPDFRWGNITNTIRWNHVFNSKLFANTSLVYSNYDYRLAIGFEDFAFDWESNLQDYAAKIDFDYFLNDRNTVTFGASTTFHLIDPGKVTLKTAGEEGTGRLSKNRALDHAIYLSNEQILTDQWTISYGGRLGIFQNIGKGVSYRFNEQFERTDSIGYRSGDIFNTYVRFEPRFTATYRLNRRSSIKASYARTTQFMHLASNSISGTPLDIWFPSSPNVEPQIADQVSGGYFLNLFGNRLETSVEVFYKQMNRQIDFKDHAELLLNPEIEGELRTGDAWAYGAEFLIRKPSGKFNGWASFTWSRSYRKIPGINEGNTYRSTFDRPVNLSVVGNWEPSKRLTFSANWVYFVGLPFTAPSGRLVYGNQVLPTYTERNGDRMPDYHRLDFSVTLDNKGNAGRKFQGSWNLSVYNLYGRKNAAFISFETDENRVLETSARKYTIFRWVPTISYNFKF